MTKKLGIILFSVGLLIVFLVWLFIESSKPLPGTKITDLGRGHVPAGEKVEYNSNPPTSGKHYEDWIRSGVYEQPQEDGYLVHSLEHGYVIMSYNCNKQLTTGPRRGDGQWTKKKLSNVKSQLSNVVYAHGIEEATSSSDIATSSASLSPNFRSEECHKLVDQLTTIYEKKSKKKLIVVPRPNLDTRIAITAWTYLDKFNQFDQNRIEKFIDVHLNQGPEKTME